MKKNGGLKNWVWKCVIFFLIWNLSFTLSNHVMALELENTQQENNYEDMNGEEISLAESMEENFLEEEENKMEEQQTEGKTDILSILEKKDRILILNQYCKNMEFGEDGVQVYETIGENILVTNLLDNIDLETLMKNYPLDSVYVVNKDGKILEYTEQIQSKSQIIFIGENFIANYFIHLVGDYNEDVIVDTKDREYIVDQILNHPEEEYSLEDASYLDYILENNTYDIPESSAEVLSSTIQIEENTYVGEKVEIQYSVHGFLKNSRNGISGCIQYDHDLLKLENIFLLIDGTIMGGFQENYFMYLFDLVHSDSFHLLFQFKALKEGEVIVQLEKVKASMNGILLELNSSEMVDFTIEGYGKGGISEIKIEEDMQNIEPKETSTTSITLEKTQPKSSFSSDITVLNQDTSIQNLEIKGYSIDFNKDCYQYYIDVNDTVDYLEFNILLSSPLASYEVTGNQNFQIGINEVILTVYAEDGSTQNYVIEVNKKETTKRLDDDSEKQEKYSWNIPLMSLVIFIVGLLISLLYFVFKEEE